MTKHFAEFYHEGTTGKIIPACGSDAHLPIDGRFGLERASEAAIQHMGRLARANIQSYTGFKLYRNKQPYYRWGRCS